MTETIDKLRLVLCEKFSFHMDQIEWLTKLELELGMDSREMIELLNELELAFQIDINFDDIDRIVQEKKNLTIEDIVNYIDEKQKQ